MQNFTLDFRIEGRYDPNLNSTYPHTINGPVHINPDPVRIQAAWLTYCLMDELFFSNEQKALGTLSALHVHGVLLTYGVIWTSRHGVLAALNQFSNSHIPNSISVQTATEVSIQDLTLFGRVTRNLANNNTWSKLIAESTVEGYKVERG